MAAGIRVQHPTERNVTFTLMDGRRPYVAPVNCGFCGKEHIYKTYHLKLDDNGSAIVSTEIVERMKQIPAMGGFSVANEVLKPPAQRLALAKPAPILQPIVQE